jgi:hypothetical protein
MSLKVSEEKEEHLSGVRLPPSVHDFDTDAPSSSSVSSDPGWSEMALF